MWGFSTGLAHDIVFLLYKTPTTAIMISKQTKDQIQKKNI